MIDKDNWIKLHYRFLDVFMKMCLSDIKKIFPILILTNESADSYTDADNSVIQIGIKDREPETEEELMMFVQYVIGHEVQHVRSTTKKAWEYGLNVGYLEVVKIIYDTCGSSKKRIIKNPKDADDYLKDLGDSGICISSNALREFIHFICNSLEDGRIERIRSNNRIDFKNQRTVIRGQEWRKNKVEQEVIDNIDEPRTFFIIIINQILSLATTRLFMQNFVAAAEKSRDLHLKIQELMPYIRKGIMSPSCRGCMENAVEIIKIIAPLMIEACKLTPLEQLLSQLAKMPSPQENFNGRDDQEETGEGDSGGSPLGIDVLAEVEKKEAENGSGNDKPDNTGKTETENPDKTEKPSGSEKKGKKTPETSEEEESKGKDSGNTGENLNGDSNILNSIDEAVKNSLNSMEEDLKISCKARDHSLKKSRMPESTSSKKDELPDISDIKALYDNVVFEERIRDYPIDQQMPIEISGPAKKLKRSIEKLLHNQEAPELRSQKSGLLDSHDLAKLAMNQLDIYTKPAQISEFDGCAYILMDNSGSMEDGIGSKRWYCSRAVAMLEEAFGCHMPVKITAFEYNRGVIHHCVKNWHETTRYNATYNYFVHESSGSGNKDGYSIRVAAKEILSQQERKKILFVLSDGLPSVYKNNNEGYSDVHNAVNMARKAGIEVISIYFGYDLKETSRDVQLFRKMYGERHSLITEPEKLGDELTKLMKRFVFKR